MTNAVTHRKRRRPTSDPGCLRVLILSQYFTPEVTAASLRLHPVAAGLAARGHDVRVICEVPNHPEGVVKDGYRGQLLLRRRLDGFSVRYVWVRTSPVKTQRSRLALYGTYALSATVAGIASPRPDVVVGSSPPLPVAAAAMAVARMHGAPWVMDVRDPWPEAPVALGELGNQRVIGALERLERRLYDSAAAVVTPTEPFRQGIAARTADPGKVSVVPNGTTDDWIEMGEREVARSDLGMPEDRFVLTYAGNVGLAQGVEGLIEAAGRLGDDFQLQIVGSGPMLEEVRGLAAGLPAGRVVLRGVVPPPEAARLLRASDASVVPLGRVAERQRSVPVKLFDCCAVGRPVILAAEGEAARLAREAEAALCIPAEDPAALVDAVRRLRDDPALRADLAERERRFARRNRREVGVERFEQILAAAVRRR